MTREELDQIVDTNVTNKTEPLSLTPQQEGFAIKKVADYVDDNKEDFANKSQDISVDAESEDKYPSVKAVVDYVEGIGVSSAKTIKVSLTHNELLNLATTPKILLPAVVDKAYLPLHFLLKYNNNAGWGNSGSPWIVKSGSVSFGSFSTQIGGGTIVEEIRLFTGGNSNTSDTFFNKEITLSATTDPVSPNEPTTTCDVYISYFEVSL